MIFVLRVFIFFSPLCQNGRREGQFPSLKNGRRRGIFFPPPCQNGRREGRFLFPSLSKMVDEEGFLHTDLVSEFEYTHRVSTEFKHTDSDDRVWTHRLSETESVVGNETEWHCLCLDFTECEHRDWVQLCSRHMTDTVLTSDEGALQATVLKINDAGGKFVYCLWSTRKHARFQFVCVIHYHSKIMCSNAMRYTIWKDIILVPLRSQLFQFWTVLKQRDELTPRERERDE